MENNIYDPHIEAAIADLEMILKSIMRFAYEDLRICSHGDCDYEIEVCANARYEDFKEIAHLIHRIERFKNGELDGAHGLPIVWEAFRDLVNLGCKSFHITIQPNRENKIRL